MNAQRRFVILDSIRMVSGIADGLDTRSYLWGGMACDVYSGRLLRDHHDLDYLTVNLHSRIDEFIDAFAEVGCETQILVNGDLKVEGVGLPIHLGHIEIDKQVRWVHDRNREQGVLCFPCGWLSVQPYLFEGLAVHVVEPELEYVIKIQPDLLNPQWEPRQKDLAALRQTEVLLRKRGIDTARLLDQVQVDSPINS